MRVRGNFSQKRKLYMQNLTKERKQPVDFLQYIYSMLVAKNH